MLEQKHAVLRAWLSKPVRALIVVVVGVVGFHKTAIPVSADELLVDNNDATVHLNGSWQRSTTTSGFFGTDYLLHAPGHGPATVRWPFPAAGTPGSYTVYVRFTSGSNRATAAVYHVAADNVASDISINQQIGGGTWHKLGTFTFEPHRGQEVSLSGEADGAVIADAVAWEGPTVVNGPLKSTILDEAGSVQNAVNSGEQPWRLDPLEVARADATARGLADTDPMQLLSVAEGSAVVRVRDASATYDLELSQPAGQGQSGIWVVDSMQRVE